MRERFAAKLHKGLSRGIPHKCLPLDFMGMYALAGQEPDKRLKATVRGYMGADIMKRRDVIKSLLLNGGCESRGCCSVGTIHDRGVVYGDNKLKHLLLLK